MNAHEDKIEWKNPPRTYGDELDDIIRALDKRPGEWARVAKNVSESATVGWNYALNKRRNIQFRYVPVDSPSLALMFPKLRRYDVFAMSLTGQGDHARGRES